MVKVKVSTGVELEYEAFGNPEHPALLLVMGLGGSLSLWRPSFVKQLVELGYFVIRFDNRDVGLSTHMDDSPVRSFLAKAACSICCGACGCWPSSCCGGKNACCLRPNYTLEDMADDTVGLLDALGVQKAVVFGGSMGGMITQFLLINHTHRVHAAVLAFTSGKFPLPDRSIRGPIMEPIPQDLSHEELLTATFEKQNMLAGAAKDALGRTPEKDFEYHKELYDHSLKRRDYYLEAGGKGRQTEAIVCSPHRYKMLRRIFSRRGRQDQSGALLDAAGDGVLPQVSIFHGLDDLMIGVKESRLLHAAIPGSTLTEFPHMGHEVHPVHFESVVALVEKLGSHHNGPNPCPPAGKRAGSAVPGLPAAASDKSE